MKVLLIGSGAREHNFAKLFVKSERCEHLLVAPGNAGTATLGKCTNVEFKSIPDHHPFFPIKAFIIENQIDILLIGPEAPLVEGLVDFLSDDKDLLTSDLRVIGPRREGAMLEGSKDFTKELMNKYNIPTAKSKTFTCLQRDEAMAYLEKTAVAPYVLKIDGLAAGKGVIITSDLKEAKKELNEMLDGKFGLTNKTVVIEEFLDGIELSVIILSDGTSYAMFPPSKDYKRIGEGDQGKNTGGMGAVSPVPFADKEFMAKVESKIIVPMMEALTEEHIDYYGFMYFGLMNVKGEPYVIEINCRMGDPEASAILPKLKTDFVDLLIACHELELKDVILKVDERPCATTVLVAQGYPDAYEKGKLITGLEKDFGENIIITHAGTKLVDGKVYTNGGRVIDITAFGDSIVDAHEKSLEVAEQIDFEGKYYRKDIGYEFIGETHNTSTEEVKKSN